MERNPCLQYKWHTFNLVIFTKSPNCLNKYTVNYYVYMLQQEFITYIQMESVQHLYALDKHLHMTQLPLTAQGVNNIEAIKGT